MEMTAEGFPIGTILLNRYRIEREINAGAMSHVYIAKDHWQPETLAIVKTPIAELLEDEWVGKKIKQEAESLARLNHPNIIKLLGHGEYNNQHPYVILEYAEGCTLREIIGEMPTSPRRAARLFLQISEAVEHAHNRDIFHRDLKPENIMVEHAGTENESVKIIDFGIARIGNSFFSTGVDTRYQIGTPYYLSPNRLNHDPDDRADDIYALGLIIYEMVTGVNPLTEAKDFDELSEIQERILPPHKLNPNLPKDAGREIIRALSLTQINRHDSARKFGTLFYNAVQKQEEMKSAPTVPIIKPVGIVPEPPAPAIEPAVPATAPVVTVDEDEFPTREAQRIAPVEVKAGNSGDLPTTEYNGAELFSPITPGERCLLAGNFEAAIAFYNEKIAQDQRSDLSYARRAMALLMKKEYDRAALDCQQAVKLNARNDFAYLIRGIIYRLKLQTSEAEAELLKAVEINQNNVEAALLLGDIYISRRDSEKALSYYEHICRVNPHFSWVYTSRGNFYYDKGDFRAAVKDFSAAIKYNPELAWNFYRRGKALSRSNQDTLAIEDLTEAIKLNPRNTTFYNDRARLYFKVGNHSEALADFNSVKELTARNSFVADEHFPDGIDKKSGFASLIEYLKQVLIGRSV